MKKSAFAACSALLCCLVVSCSDTCYEPDVSGDIVYFNSFESAKDTTGWTGIAEEMFVSDPAPKGGKQSLHIGGGCIQPTAHVVLPVRDDDASYRLSCWGKLDDTERRGAIVLAITESGEQRSEIALVVGSDKWAFYKSAELLHCPANQRLRLEIIIGGIVPASMLVDCIKVERIR